MAWNGFLRAAAGLLAVSLAGPASAQSVLDQPIEKEGWPVEVTRRPLTLAPGMLEVAVPVNVNMSADRSGKPVFVSPSVHYGVTDVLTVGLRHFLGVCLSGVADGCPKVYNDLGVDAIWGVYHGPLSDLALGVALDAAPLTDPFTLSGEVRIIARFGGGPLALVVAPALDFGITQRDGNTFKTAPLALPLATYPYGWVQFSGPGNKELLSVPASLQVQATPNVVLALSGALDGPLDPATGRFGDFYAIPIGAALVLSPSNMLDVGASFTFLNLIGKQAPGADASDLRGLQIFAAFRM